MIACKAGVSYDELNASPCPQSQFDAILGVVIDDNLDCLFPAMPISPSICAAAAKFQTLFAWASSRSRNVSHHADGASAAARKADTMTTRTVARCQTSVILITCSFCQRIAET
jgi:hypothetical protein